MQSSRPAGSTPRYKKPPIIERVISAIPAVNIPQEKFLVLAESWKDKVKSGFPIFDPVTLWNVNIEHKDGMPTLSSTGSQMEIKHWFWQQRGKPHKGLALQSHAERFSINLVRDGAQAFDFSDVYASFREYLPMWAQHFGVTAFSGCQLEYVNQISKDTMPAFVTTKGSIQLGRILTMFGKIPLPSVSLKPPYDCQINLLVEESLPCSAKVHIRSVESTIRLEIQMVSNADGKQISVDQAFGECLALHEWMIKYFEGLFTPEAKQSFEPIQ